MGRSSNDRSAVSCELIAIYGVSAAGWRLSVVAAGQTPAGPAGAGRAGGAPAAPAPPDPTVVGRTPEGFTLRLAKKTNHISNYNESVMPAYTLPDPLVMFDGRPVKTAADWKARRAEILKTYEEDIYGRVPANAPKVRWEVASTDTAARAGARPAARRRHDRHGRERAEDQPQRLHAGGRRRVRCR